MVEKADIATLGGLIRRRGLPVQPHAMEQVSEVRSDCLVAPRVPAEAAASFAIASLFIQWHYRLPLARFAEVQTFLRADEQYIADSCERELTGVHYRGTYMALTSPCVALTTIWAYDSNEAVDEWVKILGNTQSRFYQSVRTLRSFWASDPNATDTHFGSAAAHLEQQGFFALTLDAARGAAAPSEAAPRSSRSTAAPRAKRPSRARGQ